MHHAADSRRELKVAKDQAKEQAAHDEAKVKELAEEMRQLEEEEEARMLQQLLEEEAVERTDLFTSVINQFKTSHVATLGDFRER